MEQQQEFMKFMFWFHSRRFWGWQLGGINWETLKTFHGGLYTFQNQAGQRYASAAEMFRGFWCRPEFWITWIRNAWGENISHEQRQHVTGHRARSVALPHCFVSCLICATKATGSKQLRSITDFPSEVCDEFFGMVSMDLSSGIANCSRGAQNDGGVKVWQSDVQLRANGWMFNFGRQDVHSI